jgi:hypothetical protein
VPHQLADSLERHNEGSFKQEGLQFRVRVPDEVTVEVELETMVRQSNSRENGDVAVLFSLRRQASM